MKKKEKIKLITIMKMSLTKTKMNCFLLLSSLLLCLSCNDKVIEGDTFAPKGDEITTNISDLERQVQAKYYANADTTTGYNAEFSQTRAVSNSPESSWMSRLDDDVLLTNLTIPGSHLSAADRGDQYAKCQDLSIQRQLELGIRAFDIRVRHIGNSFSIHHGSTYLGKSFGIDVRDIFINFLNEHPRETIVLFMKEAYTAMGNTRSFEETMYKYVSDYPKYFMLDERNNIKLGEARKKIVLVRQFNSRITPLGNRIVIGDNGFSESNYTIKADIQDFYNVNTAQTDYKWDKVLRQMQRACGKTLTGADYGYYPNTMYINFLNGNYTPMTMANGLGAMWGVNRRLSIDLGHPIFRKGRLGIMFISFAGTVYPDIIPKLINTNMDKGIDSGIIR